MTLRNNTARKAGEGPAEAASHISAIAAGLAEIARRHGFDTLVYLLEMARLEADQRAGLAPDPPARNHEAFRHE